MKNIIIYTTNDKIVSLHLVNKIISLERYKDYKIDIFLTKPSFIRKIKIFLIIFFFGYVKKIFEKIKGGISIEKILNKYKNCKVVDKINKDYSYGLSVYCLEKIHLQKFKIYNFHLGILKYQRG